MKKRLASILADIAIMATGAASMGCSWWLLDEPNANNLLED